MALVERYEAFVKDNYGTLCTVEETMRALLMMIPGRYGQSEMASESLHVLLNMLSFYHNRIMGQPRVSPALLQVDHTPTSNSLQNVISVVQHVEILIEMLAIRSGSHRRRWIIILLIESIKAACRLALLHHNRGAMVMQATPDEAVFQTQMENLAYHKLTHAASFQSTGSPFSDVISTFTGMSTGERTF